MKIIADICIIPIGIGVSLSKYVKIAHEVLVSANLNATLHSYGTGVEGEYDDVVSAIKLAMEKLHEAGVPRLNVSVKMGSRTDKNQTMQDKIEAVKE
jgi:uncharacterized protein (TIGR00106 family)